MLKRSAHVLAVPIRLSGDDFAIASCLKVLGYKKLASMI